jgi:hypothetical protein
LLDIIGHRPSERAEDAGLEEPVDVPVQRLAGLATGPKRACLVEQNREELALGEILSSDLVQR